MCVMRVVESTMPISGSVPSFGGAASNAYAEFTSPRSTAARYARTISTAGSPNAPVTSATAVVGVGTAVGGAAVGAGATPVAGVADGAPAASTAELAVGASVAGGGVTLGSGATVASDEFVPDAIAAGALGGGVCVACGEGLAVGRGDAEEPGDGATYDGGTGVGSGGGCGDAMPRPTSEDGFFLSTTESPAPITNPRMTTP